MVNPGESVMVDDALVVEYAGECLWRKEII